MGRNVFHSHPTEKEKALGFGFIFRHTAGVNKRKNLSFVNICWPEDSDFHDEAAVECLNFLRRYGESTEERFKVRFIPVGLLMGGFLEQTHSGLRITKQCLHPIRVRLLSHGSPDCEAQQQRDCVSSIRIGPIFYPAQHLHWVQGIGFQTCLMIQHTISK
jgi:hypothetical protein